MASNRHYKAILLLFALAFLAKAHEGHYHDYKCTHDQEDQGEFELQDLDEDMSSLQEGRLLASSNHANFRMHANYDSLKSAPSDFRAYIQNDLAPAVLSWFQGALRVKYPVSGLLQVSTSDICDVKTPRELKNGIRADYAVIINHDYEEVPRTASGKTCTVASGTKRPIVGTVVFNKYQVKPTSDVLLHEKNVYLMIHEMMHTLAFSSKHYPNFLDVNGKIITGHIKTAELNGKPATVIDVPILTEKLRKHYGCPTLPGIYMENDGGGGTAGTHFERKMFLYETMCSGAVFGRRVSEFSLTFLEATGWYVPDYSYAEPFFFGQGQGCDFITATGSSGAKFEEFCTTIGRGCAANGVAGGPCYSDSRLEGLMHYEPEIDYHCENPDAEDSARLPDLQIFGRGAGSKCFTGTLSSSSSSTSSTSFCFKYTCSGSGSSTKLQVQVGSRTILCSKEGKVSVSGYKGRIDCPDPLTFCNTVGKAYCPRNCMNRGSCVRNKCVCNAGFTGVDCALSI